MNRKLSYPALWLNFGVKLGLTHGVKGFSSYTRFFSRVHVFFNFVPKSVCLSLHPSVMFLVNVSPKLLDIPIATPNFAAAYVTWFRGYWGTFRVTLIPG